MDIIDIHTHFGISKYDHIGIDNPKRFVEQLDKKKIMKAVIFPTDSEKSENSYFIQNNFIIKAAKEYPNRLIPFGRIRPADDNALEEMNRLWAFGVRGFKFHTATDNFSPDQLTYLFDRIDFNPIIIFHSYHSERTRPLIWENIIRKFKDFSFIIGHAGGDRLDEASYLVNKYNNVYIDISTNSLNRIRRIVYGTKRYKSAPIDKILYGSDFPYEFFDDNIEKILSILNKEDSKKVLSTNANRLFFKHDY